MTPLLEAVAERLDAGIVRSRLCIPSAQAKVRAGIHQSGGVIDECFTDQGDAEIQLELGKKEWERLARRFDLDQWVVLKA